MTRVELLAVAKPILFNTEMVRAILEGRKTVTRQVIKPKYSNTDLVMFTNKYGARLVEQQNDVPPPAEIIMSNGQKGIRQHIVAMREIPTPYRLGDYLFVRETWGNWNYDNPDSNATYYQYRANYLDDTKTYMFDETNECDLPKWHPSIHMPKEAARIFLRVTDVRAERLQDITIDGIEHEGIPLTFPIKKIIDSEHLKKFVSIWDNTIKKQDIDRYGWNANPWVWVIEFERVAIDE